jgi:hypothetical protein
LLVNLGTAQSFPAIFNILPYFIGLKRKVSKMKLMNTTTSSSSSSISNSIIKFYFIDFSLLRPIKEGDILEIVGNDCIVPHLPIFFQETN